MKHLTASDRTFFELVTHAAFANPFGEDRARVDARLGGEEPGTGDAVDQALANVRVRLEALWPLKLAEYQGRDQDVLEIAILFDTFHRYAGDFELLVERQIKAGAQPVQANFGKEMVTRLVEQGLEITRAVRYVGIFYQMRRAFYFASHGLIGASPSMRRLRERLWENVFTRDLRLYEAHLWDRMEDFSTFLVGGTGTGKGAAAAVLGRSSWIPYDEQAGRFAQSFTELFVPINLSQYPETLIESELFGHRKGAFTGAIDAHDGVFGRCQRHGVIFLDEIGEVDVPVQIKLLRVLQERSYSPVGSHARERFEGRVVAATNQDIGELREAGRFRDDFFYRLCSDIIEIPSLRKRLDETPEELESLVRHIVAGLVGEPLDEIVDAVLESVATRLGPDYAWPGNVRELEQCVRRVIIRGEYEGDEHRTGALTGSESLARAFEAGDIEARELLSRYCILLYERFGTYEEVGRRTGLDRRTVKRHIGDGSKS